MLELHNRLLSIYEDNEARLIAKYFFEDLCGSEQEIEVDHILSLAMDQLVAGRPLQYVTNKAYFLDNVFYVNESVLIPRPETEELVQLVCSDLSSSSATRLLDIGVGSGCISLSVKERFPNLECHGVDVSLAALEVANTNANRLGLPMNYSHVDFLDPYQRNNLKGFDLIVSNPPYISLAEMENMHDNVLMHEPRLALFTPDDDYLVFYQSIADWAIKQHHKGSVYLELNEHFAKEVHDIFTKADYIKGCILQDLQGKDRVYKCEW